MWTEHRGIPLSISSVGQLTTGSAEGESGLRVNQSPRTVPSSRQWLFNCIRTHKTKFAKTIQHRSFQTSRFVSHSPPLLFSPPILRISSSLHWKTWKTLRNCSFLFLHSDWNKRFSAGFNVPPLSRLLTFEGIKWNLKVFHFNNIAIYNIHYDDENNSFNSFARCFCSVSTICCILINWARHRK